MHIHMAYLIESASQSDGCHGGASGAEAAVGNGDLGLPRERGADPHGGHRGAPAPADPKGESSAFDYRAKGERDVAILRNNAVPESLVHSRLDVRGTVCPQPLIEVGKAMKMLRPGDRLEVLADDPIAPIDLAAYCHRTGHPLRESSKEGRWYRIVIEHR